MPTKELCHTFRKEAGNVWNRMKTAARLGLSLSEETLTECALYNIALAHQSKEILIDLATKPAEKKHGADWEWWFVRDGKALGFRVQAKRLFPRGRYNSLFKSGSDPYEQLDKLMHVSGKEGLIPLYCFYNFSHKDGRFNHRRNKCGHSYKTPSFWGCSIAFPQRVKEQKSDRLKELRNIMYPWHTLVCDTDDDDLLNTVSQFVSDRGGAPSSLTTPRDVPDRVGRLIESADQRRHSEPPEFLDASYWVSESDAPEDLAGLILFRDQRTDRSE